MVRACMTSAILYNHQQTDRGGGGGVCVLNENGATTMTERSMRLDYNIRAGLYLSNFFVFSILFKRPQTTRQRVQERIHKEHTRIFCRNARGRRN